jgi:hypothetical protein
MATGVVTPTLASAKRVFCSKGLQIIKVPLVFADDYASGGVVCDLTGLPFAGNSMLPFHVHIQGQGNAKGYTLRWVDGTTIANGKIKVIIESTVGTNSPLGEHTAVALSSNLTGDTSVYGLFFFSPRGL